MPKPRTDKILTRALRIAKRVLEERARADDLEELAAMLLELDEAVVIEGERVPRRWVGKGGAV